MTPDTFVSITSAKLGAYKLAAFAAQVFRFDTCIAFCFPSRWQPRNLRSVVVRTNRRGVGAWQRCLKFDTKANFVGVHLLRSSFVFLVGWFCRSFAMRFAFAYDTHEPCVSRKLKRAIACFCKEYAYFLRPTWTACQGNGGVQTCIA